MSILKHLVKLKLRKYKKKGRIRWEKCKTCKLSFYSKFCSSVHHNFHNGNDKGWFACHKCKKKYKRLNNFLKHRLIHRPKVEEQVWDQEDKDNSFADEEQPLNSTGKL